MSLALLFYYLMLNMFRMLIHPSISLFIAQHVSDVNTSIGLKQCFNPHTDTTPPQPNRNVTPTHIEPDQYNP